MPIVCNQCRRHDRPLTFLGTAAYCDECRPTGKRPKCQPVGIPGLTTKESRARFLIQATNNANETYNYYAGGILVAIGLSLADALDLISGNDEPREVHIVSLGTKLALVDHESGERLVAYEYTRGVARRLNHFARAKNLRIVSPFPVGTV